MRWVFVIIVFCSWQVLPAQSADIIPKTGAYLEKQWTSNGQSLNYQILYPNNFDPQKKYPLILFLHGMGERGTDNKSQLRHGSQLFLDSLQSYPAIVLFPQCPPTDYWANLSRPDEGGASRRFTFHTDAGPNPSLKMVMELIDDQLAQSYVDIERFYVAGLSMGAMGVWELLWRIPQKIAAAIPICGAGPHEMAAEMKLVPVWVIHGVKDNVVNSNYSIRMTKAIQQAGGKARISLYPDVGHNAWDPAFAEPDFLAWLFSKKNIRDEK